MDLLNKQPSSELVGVVKKFLIISDLNSMKTMYCLPDGGNFLFFNRGLNACSSINSGESIIIPKHFSASIKNNKAKKLTIYDDSETSSIPLPIILVELTPIGFYKLFKKDAYILNNAYLPIDSEINEKYFNNLYQYNDISEMINYLDKSLVGLLKYNNIKPMLIEDIMFSIEHNHNYEVSINTLMIELNITRKTMERQFKKIIGYTPKNYIYILKFLQSFLKYVEDMKTLKEMEYLYTDNAHFNVVFKNITGYTPTQLFNDVKNNKIQIYQMRKKIENE